MNPCFRGHTMKTGGGTQRLENKTRDTSSACRATGYCDSREDRGCGEQERSIAASAARRLRAPAVELRLLVKLREHTGSSNRV